MIWRAGVAAIVLLLAGLFGALAGAAGTCTQNSPDSLYLFPVVLLLNLAGMALLCWEPNRVAAAAAAILPTLAALHYTSIAMALASGTPVCTIITGNPSWEPSGEEAFLATGWAVTAAIFWIGLAYALSGGYRPAHDTDH